MSRPFPTWAGTRRSPNPASHPPNWLFGPAWTTLYILMAVAFFRVLRSAPSRAPSRAPGRLGRVTAITLFLVQIAVNAAWSWAFFAAHSPLLGTLAIAVLDAAVLATLALFWRIDRVAGLCLVPYLGWIAYATALVVAIYRLNG